MKRRHWVVGALALFLGLMMLGGPAWGANEIKIGIIGPMEFIYGKNHWNGAVLAADEINAAGGIKVGDRSMKIKLFKADSDEIFSTTTAVDSMERLILRDKVHFVMGGIVTEACLAMQDVAMDNQVMFISAGPAHPELCDRVIRDYDRYRYYFRLSPFNSDYLMKNLISFVRAITAKMNKELGLKQIRIGILGEKAMWADTIVEEAKAKLPKMGLDLVGVWRISPSAKTLTAELADIQRKECHILLTILNGPAGVTLGRQYGELKIPMVVTGILTQCATLKWMAATQGMGNYVMTATNYVQEMEYNELTRPFVDEYIKRFGDLPAFTADTYTGIKYVLKQAIEATGSLDPEALIPYVESHDFKVPPGIGALEKDELGRHRHDLKWGAGYVTGIGAQWQDGKFVAVWPHFTWHSPYWDFAVDPDETPYELSYKGMQPLVFPPWVVEAYKKN
jgi:branched-chain amino acid transport system substrate-binding protein